MRGVLDDAVVAPKDFDARTFVCGQNSSASRGFLCGAYIVHCTTCPYLFLSFGERGPRFKAPE